MFKRILAVCMLSFVFAVPVFAQDTPAPTPEPTPVVVVEPPPPVIEQPPVEQQPITPEQAGELLLGAITAIVAGGFGGAPISSFVVGLLKHIPALDDVSAPTLNLTVGGIITVLWWIASRLGLQVQFKSVSDFLLTAGPAFLLFLTTMVGASTIHKAANNENVSVFGYKRTESTGLDPNSQSHA